MKSFGPAILLSALGAFGAGHAAFGAASAQPSETGKPAEVAPRPGAASVAPGRQGNPLWAISLASLHETRDRPLFSPSRRPPAQIAEPRVSEPMPPPQPQVLEKPPFTLVGVVHGLRLDLAILVDETDKALVRLRVGQSVRGWTVHGLATRTATLEKARQQVSLELPSRNTQTAAAPASPAQIIAAAAAQDQ